MPTRREVPIALVPVEKIRRSTETIWDQIPPLGELKGLLALCAVGVAILVGLTFALVTASGPLALFDRAPAETAASAQIDPMQMMRNSKNLPAAHNDDYSLVFN